MQDKYARRRRAVLGVLVVAVLILVTAFFGEADNSPLHPIQQGIVKVVQPIGTGASKVLSPVRDLTGWITSTLHAKSHNARLRALNAELNLKLAQEGTALQADDQLRAMRSMTRSLDLTGDGPVYANVTVYDPQTWYETVDIDKGSVDGIHQGDPVIADGGLLGDIVSVTANHAVVAELSSPKFGVESKIDDSSGNDGVGTLMPVDGDLQRLQIDFVSDTATVADGDPVVTAVLSDPSNPSDKSLYPPGIPIGVISGFNDNQLLNDGTVGVTAAVNPRNVSELEVLTRVRSS